MLHSHDVINFVEDFADVPKAFFVQRPSEYVVMNIDTGGAY